jgi:hypothetical protein
MWTSGVCSSAREGGSWVGWTVGSAHRCFPKATSIPPNGFQLSHNSFSKTAFPQPTTHCNFFKSHGSTKHTLNLTIQLLYRPMASESKSLSYTFVIWLCFQIHPSSSSHVEPTITCPCHFSTMATMLHNTSLWTHLFISYENH